MHGREVERSVVVYAGGQAVKNARAKLIERMCPKCGGELSEGMFFPKKGRREKVTLHALHCASCEWVWDRDAVEARP